MKFEELRIGNLVNVPATKQEVPVSVIYNALGICVNNSLVFLAANEVEPIELTEGWLLKFGFYEPKHAPENMKTWRGCMFVNTTPDTWLTIYLILCKEYVLVSLSETIGNKKSVIAELTRIKYVHQLQNLFFALTGEELILKNK